MPVSDEYAARTVCRDHTIVSAPVLRGSLRRYFFSHCERPWSHHGCGYSHTLFNTDRVHKLGSRDGRTSYVVTLVYGRGFERYGSHDDFDSGWTVTGPDPPTRFVGRAWVHNLPKALLMGEAGIGLKKAGDPLTQYEKVQSLCRAHHERNACHRRDCKFDHDLVDSARIEKLGRWVSPASNCDILAVECRVMDGRTMWKIVLNEGAFAELKVIDPIARRISSMPYSYEAPELLDVVRHMEQVVGSTSA